MKRFFFLPLFLATCMLQAQNRHSLQLEGEYGTLFLHSKELSPIGQSFPKALNFSYSYWLLKQKNWKNCHCYPRIGLSTGYHNYDNPEILGFGIPLYGYLEPWYRLYDNLFFNLRGGAGITWLSQPYDAETNPLNLSYSLPYNTFVMVGAGLGYQLDEQWRMSLQFRYNHTSNAGLSQPNKGLNYATGNLSVDYSLKPLTLKPSPKEPFDPVRREKVLQAQLFAAAQTGATQGEGLNEKNISFLVAGASVRYSEQINRLSALTGGAEFISNYAYRYKIEDRGLNRDHNQVGLLAGHEFLLGNFRFSQMAGLYLYKDFGYDAAWYQRYGLSWNPWDNTTLGTNIKVHGHVAEFLDFRVGYNFPIP